MARKAIVRSENVKFIPAVGGQRSDFRVAPGNATPRTLSFRYGGFAIVVDGDVQVGLHATSERPLCDLEFMQFVTPKSFAATYHRNGEGFMTRTWKAGMDVVHLDGHIDLATGAHVNAPFMSITRHNGQKTRDGHFINSVFDTPEHNLPEFRVREGSNERYWFWRLSRQDEFMTFLVFIHPTGERQPIAMMRWSFTMEFVVRWEGGTPRPRVAALTPKQESPVIKDETALSSHLGIINTPPAWIMPKGNDPANFDLKVVDGLTHVALEPDFFVP